MKKILAITGLTFLAAIAANIIFSDRKKTPKFKGSEEDLQLLYGECPGGFSIRPPQEG